MKELNEVGRRFGLRINWKNKTAKSAYSEGGEIQMESSLIAKTPSYLYLGCSMNMENDKLSSWSRAALAAFAPLEEAT